MSGFETAIDCMIAAKKATGKRAGVLASYPENMPEALADKLLAAGLVPLHGMQAGLEGLRATILPEPKNFVTIFRPQGEQRALDEEAAKLELEKHGVEIPFGILANTIDDIADWVEGPIVMKAIGPNLAHKTELGAVRLNVEDHQTTLKELQQISTKVLAEEMIQDALVELIVGYAIDPVVGGHMIVGSGGVLAELIADSATLLLPFDSQQAEEALNSLKSAKLLHGYRGKPAANMDALVQALMAVQARVMRGDVAELDINPLMVTPDRAVAADALLVLGDPA